MLSGGAEAELRQLRLAQRNQTGGQKELREVAVAGLRPRIPGVGSLHSGHALDIDVVLDERRHAVEISTLAGCGGSVSPGLIEALVRQSVEDRIHRLRADDCGLDQLRRRYPSGAHGIDQRHGVEITECVVAEGVDMPHGR